VVRQNVWYNPLSVQMYHEREGHENACFCGISPPDEELKSKIVVKPCKPGTAIPDPVPRLSRREWALERKKRKSSVVVGGEDALLANDADGNESSPSPSVKKGGGEGNAYGSKSKDAEAAGGEGAATS